MQKTSSSTSIPTPFFVLMEWQVEDAYKVENKLHKLCAEWRVSNTKEFFHTDCLNTVTSFMGDTIKVGEKKLRERSYKLEAVKKEINEARNYMWGEIDGLQQRFFMHEKTLSKKMEKKFIETAYSKFLSMNIEHTEIVVRRELEGYLSALLEAKESLLQERIAFREEIREAMSKLKESKTNV